ncbi:MAG: hypothetical protein ACRDTE_18445 [Pseudonocardiaceae bacterium]
MGKESKHGNPDEDRQQGDRKVDDEVPDPPGPTPNRTATSEQRT